MDYKATLNMPKSGFPMRAGLPKREPEMLKHWEEMDLYNVMLKKNEGKPRFALHDGPPFSNGGLHMGHALNKSLKDFITRSYAMRGYYTPYIPGWDNHGMPIESAIIKEQKLNRKAMSVADFRTACHQYADKYIGIQMEGFKRIGVLGDWEHPYKTMDPGFEAEEVKVFGAMYKKGYIYKGLKPVYWCYHDETALAEAEIEYQDDPCTTVYVKFPMHDDLGKLGHLDKSKLSFVIWTTTIWTLPGNLAIALHPDESYAIVRNDDNGEMYIVAEALVEKVMAVGKVGTTQSSRPTPATSMRICSRSIRSCPRPAVWSSPIMSRWIPVRAASTPRPASARTTIRPAAATAWIWSCPSTIRAATPTMPASMRECSWRSPTPSSSTI